MPVSAQDRERVRLEAQNCCEYCRMEEGWEPYFRYHVEHIIARKHGGGDGVDNLALACHHCNLIKGPNLTSIDPDTGRVTDLFHPRRQIWGDHFRQSGYQIEGISSIGRTTVFLLRMNAEHRVNLRSANRSDGEG